MGSNSSGELADNHFLQSVELKTILRPSFRDKFGVKFYGRYRDDLLMILTSKPNITRHIKDVFVPSNADYIVDS
eukprot:2568393-Karenia_brevis.AAC.1